MSRAQLVCLHASVALLTLTGAVFALMKYGMKSDDPFAAANHPWQPHLLSAHVLVAPLAVFTFGWTFANHIWPALSNRAPKRGSGIVIMLLLVPMVISGYLLQIATEDATRRALAVTHWIASGVFVAGYIAHVLGRGRAEARPTWGKRHSMPDVGRASARPPLDEPL